eukprot:COSAG03_NODE_838_length_5668_cov_206.838391_3_plen_205_part_00
MSDVLFHEAVADLRDCLLELHGQQTMNGSSDPDVRYEAQHELFSADQQPLPGPANRAEAATSHQRTTENGNIRRQDHLSPPAVLQQDQQQQQWYDGPKDAALFPELLSSRISFLSEELAGMNQRVATLERAAGRGSGGAFSMASLEGRIAALEAAAVLAPPPAELAARITELERGSRDARNASANGELLRSICAHSRHTTTRSY